MSEKPFRWRTIIEVAVISIGLYIFLGAPGLTSSTGKKSTTGENDTPVPQAKAESLVYPDTKNLQCPEHDYDIHIFSADPLVIYIDGFLSDEEARHLVDIRWHATSIRCVISRLTKRQFRQMAEVDRIQRRRRVHGRGSAKIRESAHRP